MKRGQREGRGEGGRRRNKKGSRKEGKIVILVPSFHT
jgi:hypothetical protein